MEPLPDTEDLGLERALRRTKILQAFLAEGRGAPSFSYALSLCDEVLEALEEIDVDRIPITNEGPQIDEVTRARFHQAVKKRLG